MHSGHLSRPPIRNFTIMLPSASNSTPPAQRNHSFPMVKPQNSIQRMRGTEEKDTITSRDAILNLLTIYADGKRCIGLLRNVTPFRDPAPADRGNFLWISFVGKSNTASPDNFRKSSEQVRLPAGGRLRLRGLGEDGIDLGQQLQARLLLAGQDFPQALPPLARIASQFSGKD